MFGTFFLFSADAFADGAADQILVQFFGDNAIHVFQAPADSDISGTLAALAKNPNVRHAERNARVRIAGSLVTPNDALFSKQPYLEQIHAPDAWSVTTGSSKVVVAVLDSGSQSRTRILQTTFGQMKKRFPAMESITTRMDSSTT